MLALTSQGRVHRHRVPLRPAMHDGEIFLLDEPAFHCEAEAPCGRGVFRDQNKTARLAIEPVDDRNLPAIDEFEGE